jgi:hypothetical protein
MKSVLKRTRWARFWSAALVAAMLLAGCNEAFNLFGDDDPDDAEYVEPQSGYGDNTEIDELDLLKVLNVETVAKAIEELHDRIQNEQMGGLKLGMYLDLDSITPTGEDPILWDPETQNLRIVIASFNQYKNVMTNGGTNHIKFVFKNIPVTKKMRSGSTIRNTDGYLYDGTGTYAGNGTPELRPYLEDKFLPGLKTAMGIDVDDDTYFYTVKRDIIIGDKGSYPSGPTNWNVGTLEAAIFIDSYMEASGDPIQVNESTHTQTALYKVDSTWATTTGRANGIWWTATPKLASGNNFYCYSGIFYPAGDLIGVVPAFCIK